MVDRSAYQKAYYESRKDELRAASKVYHAEHKEARHAYHAAHKDIKREYDLANELIRSDKRLKRKYGITLAEYESLLKSQSGVCAICLESPVSDRRMDVDHSHTTGKVRGLLCNGCNKVLGLMKDNPNRLRAAADYLERNDT